MTPPWSRLAVAVAPLAVLGLGGLYLAGSAPRPTAADTPRPADRDLGRPSGLPLPSVPDVGDTGTKAGDVVTQTVTNALGGGG